MYLLRGQGIPDHLRVPPSIPKRLGIRMRPHLSPGGRDRSWTSALLPSSGAQEARLADMASPCLPCIPPQSSVEDSISFLCHQITAVNIRVQPIDLHRAAPTPGVN